MSFFVSSGRVLRYAWSNVIRNAWIGLATVMVLVLALLSVNILLGVGVLTDAALRTLENKVDVSVYFKDGTPDAVLQQAQFFMANLPQVRSAELLSPAAALDLFKQQHATDQKILDALGQLDANPLGASLVIKAKHTDDYPFLMEALQNPQFGFAIESKTYDDHADAIAQVRKISTSVRMLGIGLIAMFALFSILIVYNAVRVSVYTQREEIRIMRLVGASGLFVRLPFVFAGIFLALSALLFSTGIILGAVAYVEPRLLPLFDGNAPGLKLFFVHNALHVFSIEGSFLALLVACSSWAAVGKYLKR